MYTDKHTALLVIIKFYVTVKRILLSRCKSLIINILAHVVTV